MGQSLTEFLGVEARLVTFRHWDNITARFLGPDEQNLFMHTQAAVKEIAFLERYLMEYTWIKVIAYSALEIGRLAMLKAFTGRKIETWTPIVRERKELEHRLKQVDDEGDRLCNSPEYTAAKQKLLTTNGGPYLVLEP